MISCQIALYPLATKDFESVIIKALDSISSLKSEGLSIEVGSMSTVLKGKDEVVWKAVRTVFDQASHQGQQIVLNASFSNECGCDV